jgi:hypothetical protein
MPYPRIGIFALLLATHCATADLSAVTADGRKVVLRDNGTWAFIQPGNRDDAPSVATLTLKNKVNLAGGCRLGLTLHNDLSAQIRSLVLRFTAYKGDQLAFETVSRGYSNVKPTNSQYQQVSFRGIGCDEIRSVSVSAARNCHVGDLTKYSATAKRCLGLIEVAPSSLLPIAKSAGR